MSSTGLAHRLYHGETSFDFVGRRRRWFTVSGVIIVVGLVFLLIRGLNFGIDFKGGAVWEVPTTESVAHTRDVLGAVSPELRQATIEVLTNRQTGARTIRVAAETSLSKDKTEVTNVTDALAKMANKPTSDVTLNDVGASWGQDITHKAERALVIFLVAVFVYITFRFERKMAISAMVALVHDILITAGIYAISGFQVTPATVIAFLTILGYSLYDTIVVFDKIEENTKGLASTGRLSYTETVNLSMNQVLMRSLNTSLVAIMPILSILVIGSILLGASALQDFGLALFIGLVTGAYSSIFIASPVLAILKEREPRYALIHERLTNRAAGAAPLTPAAAAAGGGILAAGPPTGGARGGGRPRAKAVTPAVGAPARRATAAVVDSDPVEETVDDGAATSGPVDGQGAAGPTGGIGTGGSQRGGSGASSGSSSSSASATPAKRPPAPRPANRPPPRPRKKGRRR